MTTGALLPGALVLALAGVAWWRDRPPANVGAATVRSLATAGPAPGPASGPAAAGDVPASGPPVRAATLPAAPDPVVAPARLTVPSLGVTARVVPAGVDAQGQFVVPDDVRQVGWYRFGPGLDAPTGAVALAGHVDDARQGPGALFELRRLRPGDAVTLTGSDGSVHPFVVVAREEYRKSAIDLGRYTGWSGTPRLTLITCGGPFDERTRHYRDNLVVTAVPRAAAGDAR